MCRIDNADHCPEFFTQREVVGRKPHHCVECHRTIAAGERQVITVSKFEGDFACDRTCTHCAAASEWLVRRCKGFLISGVFEDLEEHWKEAGIRTRELAALIWGMRRKWRRRDGSLMPLPTLAPVEAKHAH